MAYGSFSLGLVLGWAALFLAGSALPAVLVRLAWLLVLVVVVLLSPDAVFAAAGVGTGLSAHLIWLTWLKERRA